MKSKNIWASILIIAFGLFIYSIFTRQVLFTAISLVLGIIVQKFGSDILFKEYDEKNEQKKKLFKKIQENKN